MSQSPSSDSIPIFDSSAASGCGCSGGACGPGSGVRDDGGVSRRDFLRISGMASAAVMFGGAFAGAQSSAGTRSVRFSPHLIPADKKMPAGWIRSLYEKGERLPWKGEELQTVGMPVGGIATGQLYLCGDGTLGQWEIFNHHEFLGYGGRNYAARPIPKPVSHGLALVVTEEGKTSARTLDAAGFADVEFRGEYPIGTVRYTDPEVPVRATLEAFSPFVPLNAKDSALPATLFLLTLENTGKTPVETGVISWLENPVAASAGERGWRGERHSRIVLHARGNRIVHSAQSLPALPSEPERPAVLFEGFEAADYGAWKTEGEAFGTGPTSGTLERQKDVAGFEGSGVVNSFLRGDRTRGRLISPPFTISRRYINFLFGGGDKFDLVGMNLMVGGEPVRTVTGGNSEKLLWRFWDVSEFEGKEGHLELFDESTEAWGHVLADQIEFADRPRNEHDFKSLEEFPDFGTLVWDTAEEMLPGSEAAKLGEALSEELRKGFVWEEGTPFSLNEKRVTALATRPVPLAPGEKRELVFLLSWHFPNTVQPDREAGHEYAARFADAPAVADYVWEHRGRLVADTRKWRDTWYDSTLPVWLLDRLFWPTACLATGTAQWWKNDRFWAWEGVVCCAGTCTHVWNYAQSMARLFPELERNVRERQDLGVGLEPNGLVGFRHDGKYAADGQCGTVLKVWREHLMSADDQFLRRNWAATKKVIDYLIEQDQNGDGLIENRQHNTYDIDFFGANTFVGALYLGALRAGEQMARELGENDYAERLHQIYESGRRLTEEKLWDGEYFIQQVDLKEHPEHQYGPGCLSDQMFGQNWAHQTGLGYLYSPDKVRKALESVWKYNWAPDTGIYNAKYPPERPFTDATEAGLFICTWPKSTHLSEGVRYRDEVWTGIEYQVAGGMIYEGLVEEGLALCRAVHDRYHPLKRNPYNEIECSDFYARAMASWSVLQALAGYQYHGPRGFLAFAPRLRPEHFRSAFTTAKGWGTYEQKLAANRADWKLELRHGKLRLKELQLEGPEGSADNVTVRMGGQPVAARVSRSGKQLTLSFENLTLEQGQVLAVSAGPSTEV